MRRLLIYVFSMRQFFSGGLVPLASGIFARRHRVLLLNRLQYSLGLIAASLVLPHIGIASAQLQTLCSMEMQIDGGGSCLRIPQPSAACRALRKTVVLRLPEALPHRKIVVVTRKKLPERRKPR